ncbi:MFS transporter [Rhodobacterales bacterium HKCCE3408]|nr:MFS transporter [Rhodobacterales bacterium HKCCE3408]
MGFIDGTFVSIALPSMRDSLGANLAAAQWINNGYLLPLSALILLGGALGDRFGLARIFSAGIALFVAASMGCALAPTAGTMIGARVVQGIGAAMMVPGSLALIARAYPKEDRGRAIGIWASASALTTAIGPVLAGVTLSLGGPEIWRWLFAINLPLGIGALWLISRAVAEDVADDTAKLDLPGAILVTTGLGLIALGLTAAAEGHGTARPGLALLGAGTLVLFLLWEARSRHPMVPLGLFADRGFAAANVATALIYFALAAVMFFLPMTLIAGWGLDEIWASVAFAPMMVLLPALSTPAGKLADRLGAGRLIGAGAAITALAFAGLGLGAASGSYVFGVLLPTTFMGFGMGLVVAPLSTAIMAAAPDGRSGTASGINNAVSRVAGLIAVAALGSLAGAVYAAAGGGASFGSFSDLDGHAEATVAAFRAVALVTAALTAAGAAIAWIFIPRPES